MASEQQSGVCIAKREEQSLTRTLSISCIGAPSKLALEDAIAAGCHHGGGLCSGLTRQYTASVAVSPAISMLRVPGEREAWRVE